MTDLKYGRWEARQTSLDGVEMVSMQCDVMQKVEVCSRTTYDKNRGLYDNVWGGGLNPHVYSICGSEEANKLMLLRSRKKSAHGVRF